MDSQMDSNHCFIEPFLNHRKDSICFSFGTQLKIRKLSEDSDKPNRDIKLMNGFEDNVFIGRLDSTDADIEIRIDNSFGTKNICYGIKLTNNYRKRFYLSRGHVGEHKALGYLGRQLHVKCQSSEAAKTMVRIRANTEGISLSAAAIECSRIKFTIDLEKGFEILGQRIEIMVKYRTMTGGHEGTETLKLTIGDNNKVEDIKRLIESIEGFAIKDQIIYYKLKPLANNEILRNHSITNSSVLGLEPKVLGGRGLTEDVMNEMYGSRGLLCLGAQTDQPNYPKVIAFKSDDKLKVKPFVVELRCFDE